MTKSILGIPLNISPIILNKLNKISTYKKDNMMKKKIYGVWELFVINY